MPFINLPPTISKLFDEMNKRISRLETSIRFSAPVVNGSPTYLKDGDIWIDSNTGKMYAYYNGSTKLIVTF
jgi:hypothetical protein